MGVLDGNFALGCGPWMDYPLNTYIAMLKAKNT